MKKIKNILLIIFAIGAFSACEVTDREVDKITGGSNLAVFESSVLGVAQIADGEEYDVDLAMKLQGPSASGISSDVVVTVAVDASSTAVEGTHYRLDNTSVTLNASNNHLGLFSVKMLTEGIVTPLPGPSPILVLKVSTVSGASNVIASSKTIAVTLNYACPSDLAGNYTVTVLRDGGVITPYTSVSITEIGVGTYRTSEVGHWSAGSLGGTPGYTFTDVCGVLSIPRQNLVDLYSNIVQGFVPGSVDEGTGELHTVYKITSTWESEYDNAYVPVK